MPLTRDQFARAIRRAARLEPKRRARPHPVLEAIRRRSRARVVLADRAARLDALGAVASEPGFSPRERRMRTRLHRAAAAAGEWSAREWYRGNARLSPHDAWLAELAAAGADHAEPEGDDVYPVEWLDADWMAAPDFVAFAGESGETLIPRSNTAAGAAEHLEAIQRNTLFDTYRSTRARAWFQEGVDEYVSWLAGELDALGGVPSLPRGQAGSSSPPKPAISWAATGSASRRRAPASGCSTTSPSPSGWRSPRAEIATPALRGRVSEPRLQAED